MTARARVGVLIPATNTVVEDELWVHAPDAIDLLTARIPVPDPTIGDDGREQALVDGILSGIDGALQSVASARPDLIVLAVSAASLRDGLHGLRRLELETEAQAGVPVVAGARALLEELSLTRGARRVACLTPYHATNDGLVERMLGEGGFEVVSTLGLEVASATAIAEVPDARVVAALHQLARLEVDVIVQMGTNLPVLHLDRDATAHLGTPLLAINRCLLSAACRRLGIAEARPV